MSYYWFIRQEILQKVKGRYSKAKDAEYYAQNKEATREKSIEHYKNIKSCRKKKKKRLRSIKEKSIKNWFSIKRNVKREKNFCFFVNVKNE